MKNSAQDKMEEARIAREREMEALMVARTHAIEEEEMERAAEEAERRSVQGNANKWKRKRQGHPPFALIILKNHGQRWPM